MVKGRQHVWLTSPTSPLLPQPDHRCMLPGQQQEHRHQKAAAPPPTSSAAGEAVGVAGPVVGDAMHHVGGPLAMVTPLHAFDGGRLRRDEDSLAAATITSHQSQTPPLTGGGGGGGSQAAAEADTPVVHPSTSQEATPTFLNPSDQAQFEADKRLIYKSVLAFNFKS